MSLIPATPKPVMVLSTILMSWCTGAPSTSTRTPMLSPVPEIRLPRTSRWLPEVVSAIPVPPVSIVLPVIRTPLAPTPLRLVGTIPSRRPLTAVMLLSSTRRPSNLPLNAITWPVGPVMIVSPATVTS